MAPCRRPPLLLSCSASLLEVSTSDDSCFSVCVRFRDASARARVSSVGFEAEEEAEEPGAEEEEEEAVEAEEEEEAVEEVGGSHLHEAAAAEGEW